MSVLGEFVADSRAAGQLVVQPRMGFASPEKMRTGLLATKELPEPTVGTITLDSYTRLGDSAAAQRALRAGDELNGYPIVSHPLAVTRDMLTGIADQTFPVQVRHGSPSPERIFDRMVQLGLGASEGGPVSYCLPYGRSPLEVSVSSWVRGCALLCRLRDRGIEPHLETFGGCLLGQLCPPSLLVALSVLEAAFFAQNKVRCVSLSYAQQVHFQQDREAVAALRTLAARFLPEVTWHVVIYAYMGMYPVTPVGAMRLLKQAVHLAVVTGSERIIVKTAVEASRIPTIAENLAALQFAATSAREALVLDSEPKDTGILAEATALVQATLDLHSDIGTALKTAFARGYLDVPFCLHPDNGGRTSCRIDGEGRLVWADSGSLPVPEPVSGRGNPLTSAELLTALGRVCTQFDAYETEGNHR
ncbi:methylaspartate mutase [Saccharomonospora azurea]|uniref:methylaspartate mutase n=1 Tax=Saccharomonospora azurea TaxID=40988 RepID=UPI00024000BD|nr:methylaspartate mutase [Saccharomonospora azurea]EHK89310.1 Methylaspartate mutase [Saccharomonospora azurea SZMC 14600]